MPGVCGLSGSFSRDSGSFSRALPDCAQNPPKVRNPSQSPPKVRSLSQSLSRSLPQSPQSDPARPQTGKQNSNILIIHISHKKHDFRYISFFLQWNWKQNQQKSNKESDRTQSKPNPLPVRFLARRSCYHGVWMTWPAIRPAGQLASRSTCSDWARTTETYASLMKCTLGQRF